MSPVTIEDGASESTPLLPDNGNTTGSTTRRNIEVVPMKYRYVWAAVVASDKVFENDDVIEYLYGAADTNPFRKTRLRIRRFTSVIAFVYGGRALTLAEAPGSGFLHYGRPNDSRPPLMMAIRKILGLLQSKEIQKRNKEAAEKIGAAVIGAFGGAEKLEEMWEIQGLIVSPKKQGKGYGTALVRAMLEMSDADGRDSWVTTGRAHGFYASLGYVVVAKVALGVDNPTWHDTPPEMIIMHRPAKISAGHTS